MLVALCMLAVNVPALRAQDTVAHVPLSTRSGADSADLSLPRTKVDVNPVARDEEIRRRLQSVLEATQWFVSPRVRVESGVVFLDGQASSDALMGWAGDLARNTQDVVAVVNRMTVPAPSIWDFRPASRGLRTLWRDLIGTLPSLALAAVILGLSLGAAVMTVRGARRVLEPRLSIKLLRTVIVRALGALVLLVGVYVILRVMGLTQLALTIVGGTGLIGLAVGIAFRDITENFLASIFLSIQRPFELEDLIEVAGVTGYVQQLNMRTTVMMNLDGNVVQIPNATVYKSNLRNYTTNCNRREVFDIGIGYDDAIGEAQEVARRVLATHPAVLDDPEPSVLVDSLGASTVNLRIYFWLDGSKNGWLKVRSSVIRLVKREFDANGISMPDTAREIIFPQGVPIVQNGGVRPRGDASSSPGTGQEVVSTKAEGGLHTEAPVIAEQARQSRKVGETNLLEPAPDTPLASNGAVERA
jgi:small conductance mechanosensitive channel